MFVIKTNQDMTGTTKYKRQINLFKNLRKIILEVFQRETLSPATEDFGKWLNLFEQIKVLLQTVTSLKKGNEIITADKDLSENFISHYVKIIKKTTWSKPDTDLHKFYNMDIQSAISKIKGTMQITLVL